MPVDVMLEEEDMFIMRAHGPVTYDEVRAAIERLALDPGLRPGMTLFIDNRGVTGTPTIGEVAAIASHFEAVFVRGIMRLALLSDSPQVHDVAKMFASFASTVGAEAKGFQHEEQARSWLRGSSTSG